MAAAPQTYWHAQGVRTPTSVFPTSADAVQHVVLMVENLIRERQSAGLPCVLGLPTGSTPVSVYRQLVRLHKEQKLDFSNVVTFNLDEYYPIKPDELQSYRRFMNEQLFDHVNIRPENIHIPDGTIPVAAVDKYCEEYELQIRRAGGIDLLLLGIGRTGHIGFNEPGATRASRTRSVRLDPVTRRDAGPSFFGEENVPNFALTMGIGSILDARKIVLLAFGEHKASILKKSLEEPAGEHCPASMLQHHPNAVFVIDEPGAGELTVRTRPWEVGRCEWTRTMIRKAVIWLSLKEKKALLKLQPDHFRRNNLHELLREHGPAERLCRQVFAGMMQTVCDEPGGATPQRCLCFSPHPDDDVISMGGTLIRLVQQQHDVHIAYMTSGNVAVHDRDAIRFANFVADYNRAFGIENQRTEQIEGSVYRFLTEKKPGQVDSEEVLAIKGLVRKTEAIAGAKVIGIGEDKLHFLDLPFYHTGRVGKKPLSEDDVKIVHDLLVKLKPGQIYVAGDLADPHGTHRICADAIFRAVERYRSGGGKLEVWLYRGAWQEWEPHLVERAVPLSPSDLELKKAAIFRHESQKDGAMFPGTVDTREFWQR
ncbi:MAG TPA: glucosamine-6-phosphate deaminase, partial [Planctomycetia bacterium]|nr:glucosamine-6-phosphate deaminase [Planctomycetia bacterium]